jgi:hypothetical protein
MQGTRSDQLPQYNPAMVPGFLLPVMVFLSCIASVFHLIHVNHCFLVYVAGVLRGIQVNTRPWQRLAEYNTMMPVIPGSACYTWQRLLYLAAPVIPGNACYTWQRQACTPIAIIG